MMLLLCQISGFTNSPPFLPFCSARLAIHLCRLLILESSCLVAKPGLLSPYILRSLQLHLSSFLFFVCIQACNCSSLQFDTSFNMNYGGQRGINCSLACNIHSYQVHIIVHFPGRIWHVERVGPVYCTICGVRDC